MADMEVGQRPRLTEDLRTDVCVVGAGIAGLTTAHLLATEGRSVVLLDRHEICRGETARTTAHLSNALDDRYSNLEKLFGQACSRRAAESHTAAIGCIESICGREGIDCEFTRLDGYLFKGPGESLDILERERDAAHRAGLTGVELVDRAPMPLFDTGCCLRFPDQAQFHPLRYAAGLVEAIEGAGGRIFAGSPVVKGTGGEKACVKTLRGDTVTAGAVVLATNTPIHDNLTIHA